MASCKRDKELDFDLESVLEETGLDQEEYLEIYDLFKESFEELMQELEAAAARSESDKVMQAAHTLKGACSNIGFMKMARLAQQIQENPENTELAAASIPELGANYTGIERKIKAATSLQP